MYPSLSPSQSALSQEQGAIMRTDDGIIGCMVAVAFGNKLTASSAAERKRAIVSLLVIGTDSTLFDR